MTVTFCPYLILEICRDMKKHTPDDDAKAPYFGRISVNDDTLSVIVLVDTIFLPAGSVRVPCFLPFLIIPDFFRVSSIFETKTMLSRSILPHTYDMKKQAYITRTVYLLASHLRGAGGNQITKSSEQMKS